MAFRLNALNQPTSIWSATAGWINFGYDPLGRPVKRWSDSAGATYLYYEGWNLIQEGPSAASASRLYIHGGRVDEIVKQITPSNGWARFFHYDARGHASLQTDSSGNIVEQYEYDAFGQPYFFDAAGQPMTVNGQPGSTWGNRFLFTGREYLSDLKLYDYRHRLYQPELGRFLQPDPIQFAAGDYNLYRYCHNDPVNKTDPMGLAPPEVHHDERKKPVVEAQLKQLREIPSFKEKFKETDANSIRNVIKDAQNPDNPAGRTPNGLKANRTTPGGGLADLIRRIFGGPARTVTINYDPTNPQTATGRIRAPIFGLANEVGEMFSANDGTWGQGGPVAHDNRSIWWENEARRAFGAELRPYKTSPFD